jgi:hypothetical protein
LRRTIIACCGKEKCSTWKRTTISFSDADPSPRSKEKTASSKNPIVDVVKMATQIMKIAAPQLGLWVTKVEMIEAVTLLIRIQELVLLPNQGLNQQL